MTGQRGTLLCHYRYDPLDRVVGCAPLNQESVQRYYRKNRLATEIQGQVQYSVFEHDQQLLAQQQHQAGSVDSTLLATDLQRSVLQAVAVGQHQKSAYSPYGHRSPESGLMSLLGFNGERRDPVTGHYLLGNGYRAFNPVLMRFNSPDSLSPFGMGGVNAYAYCVGDPVNRVDPTGHSFLTAVFGKYFQRVAASGRRNSLPTRTSKLDIISGARNSSVSNTSKTGPALELAEIPIKGGSYDVAALEALDLANARGSLKQSNKHLSHLLDKKEQAVKHFEDASESHFLLKQDVESKGLDPAKTPLGWTKNAYEKSGSAFHQASVELLHREEATALKYYASQKQSALADLVLDVRRAQFEKRKPSYLAQRNT